LLHRDVPGQRFLQLLPRRTRSLMVETALLALGLVLVLEGLVYALAPSIVEELLEMLRSFSEGQRRTMGLMAVALGVLVVWIAKSLGA
ncbi:DUF2065 family protein, partial [Shimia sp.]|uniref:DUF2065 family protein n=2 Tax=Shimia TaxID=573139 RepID=UPI00342ED855